MIVYIILVTLFVLGLVGLLIYQVKENKREKIENDVQIEKLREENKELIKSNENA